MENLMERIQPLLTSELFEQKIKLVQTLSLTRGKSGVEVFDEVLRLHIPLIQSDEIFDSVEQFLGPSELDDQVYLAACYILVGLFLCDLPPYDLFESPQETLNFKFLNSTLIVDEDEGQISTYIFFHPSNSQSEHYDLMFSQLTENMHKLVRKELSVNQKQILSILFCQKH